MQQGSSAFSGNHNKIGLFSPFSENALVIAVFEPKKPRVDDR